MMKTQNQNRIIPGSYEDLLESTALVQVAMIGPEDEPQNNLMAKKYLGLDKHPNHKPGDERVVVFVRPDHTTQMGG